MRKSVFLLASFCMLGAGIMAQEKVDLDMIKKIRNEGLNNSKVMDIAYYLTDVSGPRLTVSPGYTRAANWAKSKLTEWGLTNVALESWGEFGKGWELKRSYVAMTAPYYQPMIAFPKAWTVGTKGLISGEVMIVDAKDSADYVARFKGKVAGKIIITALADNLNKLDSVADGSRYSEADLAKIANPQPDTARRNGPSPEFATRMAALRFRNKLKDLINADGAAAIISSSVRSKHGTVFVQGGGPYKLNTENSMTDIAMGGEDYLRIQRLVSHGVPVKLEMDIQTDFPQGDSKGYNVVGEIPGTDKKLKDEVVMVGAHLDSWHGATGATDNAAGSAVMMEVVRILKALNVQPRRTIRIALWNGEEQGLYGSAGYVKNHFADPATMELKPEHAKLAGYFNLDNGSGKIRGVYMEGNEGVRPIFEKWLEPFKDLGATTLTKDHTGGTDHLSFDAVGLPGFQFIQDELEYDTRTHHSNMDTYDRLLPDDLKQAATIIAAFVYQTAQRDEKLPRKELPKPKPPRAPF